ncbi:GNAT family N-acetyltransferase [Ottowia thiooxydans]|uniref:GNAT family N-acetyltransferase n=1 Tax=Ottowia thiooxydans TaxID=219182 RepID=UPI0004135133|nr:GNAT family N-acetyltransferase [Ottowia thiooxydans]
MTAGSRACVERHAVGYDLRMRDAFSDLPSAEVRRWNIRPLELNDLDGLMQVQEACYGSGYMESMETYRARLACPAQCSLVVVQQGVVLAYLAAYRSTLGSITPLHGNFPSQGRSQDGKATPSGGKTGERGDALQDTLYLHDMAVSPDYGAQGLASALLTALWESARDWSPRYAALVSVQGSQSYWARKGYAVHAELTEENTKALRSYGHDAVYMTRPY